MARVLVLEKEKSFLGERRSHRIRDALRSLGHTVIEMSTPAEVIPYLRVTEGPIDAVALSVFRPDTNPDSFDVVRELCRDPVLREVGKILVFPRQADPREEEQMYGPSGVVSIEPHLHRTVAVSESNLLALREAILAFQMGP